MHTWLWVHSKVLLALDHWIHNFGAAPIGWIISICGCHLNNRCAWGNERDTERPKIRDISDKVKVHWACGPCIHSSKLNPPSDSSQRACAWARSSAVPMLAISGTVALYGPPWNTGGLSLMSCTRMMNWDEGSRARPVCLSVAVAIRRYSSFSSLSRGLVTWMFPVLLSMTNTEPAPSPFKTYLIRPSPLSTLEWS